MMLLLAAVASTALAGTLVRADATSTDRGEVAWWEMGSGDTTVMLVHGLPTSKEMWMKVAGALSEQHRVVVVDLPDFGDSNDDAAQAAGLRGLVHKDRARALEAVRADVGAEQIVLVAHDLGSSVAVDYMGLFPERVQRLVLMSSPVYPDFEEPGVVKLVRVGCIGLPLLNLAPRAMIRSTMKKGLVNDQAYDAVQLQTFLDDYPGAEGKRRLHANLSWGFPDIMFAEYPQIMKGIAAPTLLLHGREDPFIPMAHAERMDRDIPDSRLVIIDDGAHFLPLDTPARVAQEVLNFIEEGER